MVDLKLELRQDVVTQGLVWTCSKNLGWLLAVGFKLKTTKNHAEYRTMCVCVSCGLVTGDIRTASSSAKFKSD